MEKILIFILFLGPLVFFHELGHYLFARLFGVRVEVFSLGFGPKIFRFKKGDTEYAVSLIPLGGYVKMFGDDPLNKDAIPEEDRPFSFTHKNKWARFWIVLGGPLANFIMAYVIFFSLLMIGEKIPEIKIGYVTPESKFYDYGFRSGDVIKNVNGKAVLNPSDIVLEGSGVLQTVGVERLGALKVVELSMTGEAFFEEFTTYPPFLRRPVLVDSKGNFFAASFSPMSANLTESLEEMNGITGEKTIYLFPKVEGKESIEKDAWQSKYTHQFKVFINKPVDLIKGFNAAGYRTIDLVVKSRNMNSPADKAGIKGSDVIVSLEGKSVYSFEQLRRNLQLTKTKSVKIGVLRQEKLMEFTVTPDIKNRNGKDVKLIGVYSAGEFLGINFVNTSSRGLVDSFLMAFTRTWDSTLKTLDGFKKLITGNVSLKSIGGPLAIGKVASDSFNTSLTYFFQLMALISINLGIINLFPIPVLDGGHIMFIFLEIINRGPVSRRKMEIAQQLGLSLLLMLMVGAIFNDVSRFF
ncbi:MAG: RIP metalloprotease RseP [Halobacteriovoraceae bacterium]|jgi:regulator of sigma E protease|nr:RIP metalloprotease RseP [Halobacteriovoraceae bacterium]MBT5093808.1 RIP metalloprotease RseP [Halobacteriovoraceae bacterium]